MIIAGTQSGATRAWSKAASLQPTGGQPGKNPDYAQAAGRKGEQA
jgi:hypothetical protein